MASIAKMHREFFIFNGITYTHQYGKTFFMKSKILLLATIIAAGSATAQMKVVDYQYKNNTFSVAQQDKQLSNKTTGKIFYSRVRAFDSFSKKSVKKYISREDFVKYLGKFAGLTKIAKMNGYADQEEAINVMYNNLKGLSRLSNDDAFRLSLYNISAPVYKVIDESWGNDMVDAVIKEAYLNLYEYVKGLVAGGDRAYTNAMAYVNMDPIKTDESKGYCQFTVNIDTPVLKKDDIQVYFSDMPLFKKISKTYDAGGLLEGPINGWAAYKDESEAILAQLQGYEGQKREIPAYYAYGYNLKDYGNPATVQQNLHKGMKWFVWVFRNGVLYYSYMAVPCSDLNTVTVYEERKQAGLEAPGTSDGGYGSFE